MWTEDQSTGLESFRDHQGSHGRSHGHATDFGQVRRSGASLSNQGQSQSRITDPARQMPQSMAIDPRSPLRSTSRLHQRIFWVIRRLRRQRTERGNQALSSQNTDWDATSPLQGRHDLKVLREQFEGVEKRLQGNVSMYRRIRWVESHRTQLRDEIRSLSGNYNQLMQLLQIYRWSTPTALLSASEHLVEEDPSHSLHVSDCFERAHLALKSLEQCDKGQMCSLQLMFDFQRIKQKLQQEEHINQVRISQGSHVSNLIRDTDLLMMETGLRCVQGSDSLRRDPQLQRLERLERPSGTQARHGPEEFEAWGYIANRFRNRDYHVIFQDPNAQLSQITTFKDILEDGSYRERTTPQQITQLGRILILAYMYLGASSIEADCGHPKLHQVTFFGERPGDFNELWKWPQDGRSRPKIEFPWLQFGFGQKGRKQHIFEISPLAPRMTSFYLDLAIFMYQVGTGDLLVPSSGSSPEAARAELKNNVRVGLDDSKVDRKAGPGFAEVVQALFDRREEQIEDEQAARYSRVKYLQSIEKRLAAHLNEVDDLPLSASVPTQAIQVTAAA